MINYCVLSAPRSGSNLLCALLNIHPDCVNRGEIFDRNGVLLASLERDGTGFGDLYIMAFSPTYGIFASDHWSSLILHLDPALNIQGIYGNSGRRTGQFNRIGWMDVYKDLLAVADMRNHRIQIFDIKKTFSS